MTASLHTLLDVALRTSVVYLALLVGLRLTGTRQLGQMSTFDLVLLLIIANAVQNAMVGPDVSLQGDWLPPAFCCCSTGGCRSSASRLRCSAGSSRASPRW